VVGACRLKKNPSVVSIAAWPIRLMDESLAPVRAEQVRKSNL